MTAVKALEMNVSELGNQGEAYKNHEGQVCKEAEAPAAADDNRLKSGKGDGENLLYHQLQAIGKLAYHTPTRRSKDDIQIKLVEKEASRNMAAYACGISKIDLREL